MLKNSTIVLYSSIYKVHYSHERKDIEKRQVCFEVRERRGQTNREDGRTDCYSTKGAYGHKGSQLT